MSTIPSLAVLESQLDNNFGPGLVDIEVYVQSSFVSSSNNGC